MPLLGLLYLPALVLATLGATTASAQDEPEMGPRNINPRVSEVYGQWLPLDQVAIVVNGDIVTQRKIHRKVGEALSTVSASTESELRQVVAKTQREEIKSLLMRQAGEDMGLPPEAVAAHVAGILRDQTDEAGGSFAMSERLREDSTTALELKEDRAAEVYSDSFRRAVAGLGGNQERSSEDRFVRPGQLVQRFRRMQRTGQDIHFLRTVGAVPATYDMQILLISPRDGNTTMEQIRDRTTRIRAALEAGQVQWTDMLDEHGVFENSGLMGPQPIHILEAYHDPGDGQLLQFAMEGAPESLSPVMPFPQINQATGQRTLGGFAIYKLLDRSAAKVPGFREKDVQFNLRRWIQREGDDARLDDAVTELGRTAYVWSPSHDAQMAAQQEAKAEREQKIQEARKKNAEKMRQRAEQSSGEPKP
jgi:hypothetical protein